MSTPRRRPPLYWIVWPWGLEGGRSAKPEDELPGCLSDLGMMHVAEAFGVKAPTGHVFVIHDGLDRDGRLCRCGSVRL